MHGKTGKVLAKYATERKVANSYIYKECLAIVTRER